MSISLPTSIRLRGVAWFKRAYLLVQSIAQFFCHVVIKAKASDDSGFGPKFPIPAYTGPVGNETNDMLGTPVPARGNAINYQIAPFCQVDKNGLVVGLHRHQQSSVGGAKLNASALGVESALPTTTGKEAIA